ncbi:MAG: hypothetical protein U9Q72_00830 [Patescibacteria group bacterium]|nr:hypothetical protein [Patescibacteria group bacterium]
MFLCYGVKSVIRKKFFNNFIEEEEKMRRLRRGRALGERYEFLMIIIVFVAILILAVWIAHATSASASNLPDKVERELAMEAWEEITQVNKNFAKTAPILAKLGILQTVERFAEKRIRWAEGIEDEERIYLHPLGIQRAAMRLTIFALQIADLPPFGDENGSCSLPEFKRFLKKYDFHYKVVKIIAGTEE